MTLAEFLAADGFVPHRAAAQHLLFHRHCHQEPLLSPAKEVDLLHHAGHHVDVLDSGCCGMAGAFGFQRAKYDLSVALAERVLLPAVRAAPDATVVADGFSCREQLRQLGGIRARHLAELLAADL
jgi:Fe-S oxidoreductase